VQSYARDEVQPHRAGRAAIPDPGERAG
jgi:hypothetical protein